MAITSYLSIFEDKLKRTIKRIEKELSKAKKERNRATLKNELKIAKSLKKTVHQLRKETALCCPHCGGEVPIN